MEALHRADVVKDGHGQALPWAWARHSARALGARLCDGQPLRLAGGALLVAPLEALQCVLPMEAHQGRRTPALEVLYDETRKGSVSATSGRFVISSLARPDSAAAAIASIRRLGREIHGSISKMKEMAKAYQAKQALKAIERLEAQRGTEE